LSFGIFFPYFLCPYMHFGFKQNYPKACIQSG
jgi:hypothetical protein